MYWRSVESLSKSAIRLVVIDPARFPPMPSDGIDEGPSGAIVDRPETGRSEECAAPASALGQKVLGIAQIHAINPVRRGATKSRCETCDVENDVARGHGESPALTVDLTDSGGGNGRLRQHIHEAEDLFDLGNRRM